MIGPFGRPGLTQVATVLAIGFASMLCGVLEVVNRVRGEEPARRYDELAADVERVAADRRLDVVS